MQQYCPHVIPPPSGGETASPCSAQIRMLANHGKPWDCKAMGTKVSFGIYAHNGAMLARLLNNFGNPSERTVAQSYGA